MEGTVIIADDDKNLRSVLTQAITRSGAQVRATATLATLWRWLEEGEGDVVLTDVNLADGDVLEFLPKMKIKRPDLQFVVMSAQNTVVTALRAGEAGAFDYLAKPFDLREMLQTLRRAQGQNRENKAQVLETSSHEDLPLIGRSVAMQTVYRHLSRIIPSEQPVLIFGAAGTGKSLVADVIHKFGPHKNGPCLHFYGNEASFYAISEAFERANGGTLVLENVDEFFANEQRQIQMLMDQQSEHVRIIAITRKNLYALVQQGQFREDLFFRLNVLTLELPGLLERDEDIIELAEYFLSEEGGDRPKLLSDEAKEVLMKHHWPGNVNELLTLIKRVSIMTSGDVILGNEIENHMSAERKNPLQAGFASQNFGEVVEHYVRRFIKLQGDQPIQGGLYEAVVREVERPLIEVVLDLCGGNQLKAAKMLDINRNTLRKRIEELDISVTKSKKLM